MHQCSVLAQVTHKIYNLVESALFSGWYFLPSIVFIFMSSVVTTPLSLVEFPLSGDTDVGMGAVFMKLSLEPISTTQCDIYHMLNYSVYDIILKSDEHTNYEVHDTLQCQILH